MRGRREQSRQQQELEKKEKQVEDELKYKIKELKKRYSQYNLREGEDGETLILDLPYEEGTKEVHIMKWLMHPGKVALEQVIIEKIKETTGVDLGNTIENDDLSMVA